MHQHIFENENGDAVDVAYFCTETCHRDWCYDHGIPYGGWNGCYEGPDCAVWCEQCEAPLNGWAEKEECAVCDVCDARVSSFDIGRVVAYGIETFACSSCRTPKPPPVKPPPVKVAEGGPDLIAGHPRPLPNSPCPLCGGEGMSLGAGWSRCRRCGIDHRTEAMYNPESEEE